MNEAFYSIFFCVPSNVFATAAATITRRQRVVCRRHLKTKKVKLYALKRVAIMVIGPSYSPTIILLPPMDFHAIIAPAAAICTQHSQALMRVRLRLNRRLCRVYNEKHSSKVLGRPCLYARWKNSAAAAFFREK